MILQNFKEIDVSVSSLGSINKANITIRPFTVIAGPNGSGKSFITKLSYCFLRTMSVKHLALKMSNVYNIGSLLLNFMLSDHPSENTFPVQREALDDLSDILKIIDITADLLGDANSYSHQTIISYDLYHRLKQYDPTLIIIQNSLTNKYIIDETMKISSVYDSTMDLKRNRDLLEKIYSEIINLIDIISNPIKGIQNLIQEYLLNEILENFQISSINQLLPKNSSHSESFIEFKELGKIIFSNNPEQPLTITFNDQCLDSLKDTSAVVFIESPIYWKLRRALSEQGNRARTKKIELGRDNRLTGVPKHFLDLNALVDMESKQDKNSILDISSSISKFIKGKLTVTERGDINFYADKYHNTDSNDGVSLTLTASGIINLGIIQLLIERGVITKNSTLIIDEPEVNLHPAWQKVLIEILFELSQKGVMVIITTHSIDIMKCVELLIVTNKKIPPEYFGINQLSDNGESINENVTNNQKVSLIQIDLGQPFSDMFINIGLES